MITLSVVADTLDSSSLPIYHVPKDWPFPIWSVHTDGHTIIQIQPINDNIIIGLFELCGSQNEIQDKIKSILTRLILTAGFAGLATIAVRADYKTHDAHFLNIGIYFTAHESEGNEIVQWNAPRAWKPESFPEIEIASKQLQNELVITKITLS